MTASSSSSMLALTSPSVLKLTLRSAALAGSARLPSPVPCIPAQVHVVWLGSRSMCRVVAQHQWPCLAAASCPAAAALQDAAGSNFFSHRSAHRIRRIVQFERVGTVLVGRACTARQRVWAHRRQLFAARGGASWMAPRSECMHTRTQRGCCHAVPCPDTPRCCKGLLPSPAPTLPFTR